MLAILVGGAICALSIRREFFPEIDTEAAIVSLVYPGATPQEVEESLAIKVEDAIRDLDEVDTIRSTLSEGGGGIVVELKEGIGDPTEAIDEIERRIDALQDLPVEAERIVVSELDPRLPVIMVVVYGDVPEDALKRAVRAVQDDLRELPGMGEVLISGVRDYEIRVDVDAVALMEHSISLPQVQEKVAAWMADVPGGAVRGATGDVNVRTIGVRERAEAIRQIAIKADAAGQSLRLGDIARVHESFEDAQILTRFDGLPAAQLTVFTLRDLDLVQMAEMVRAYVDGRSGRAFHGTLLERLRHGPRLQAYTVGAAAAPLPPGCAIAAHSDLARFVEGRLALLQKNAMYGALLVVGTLLLFLNWRVAFWVGVGLVTALAGTLIMMRMTGVTLNLLTMFGLIVVLGILVDDAIVVAENVQARHDRGESSLEGAVRGTEQVLWPVVATVLTTIVAFIPLTFVRGRIGDLLGALPMVVSCALAVSLVESLLILPSHMGHSLVRRDRRRPRRIGRLLRGLEARRDRLILGGIVPAYGRFLEAALRFRYLGLTAAVALLIVSGGMLAGGRLPFVFLQTDDSETIVVNLRMALGTSIQRTSAVVETIERVARRQPETRSVSAIVGQRTDMDTGVVDALAGHLADLYIELHAVEARERSASEVVDSIRQAVGWPPDAEHIRYGEVTGGPGGADITVELRGDDIERVIDAAEEVKRELASYKGVQDIFDDHAVGQRELQITLRPGAAALGFTVADVARQVRGALFGLDAHVFAERREDIDVRLRLDEVTRRSLAAVEGLWVIGPGGARVPLSEIADLADGTSYATIKRINGQRAITVTAETAPQLSPETITATFAGERLPAIRARHPEVRIQFAGRQEQLKDAFASLPLGFAAAMIMIYVILAWLFASYTLPITVMMAVPFGVVGMIWGHVLLGFEMTFLSLIGFVALSGIVVNDSLILMDFYLERRAAGASMRDGLVEAGRQRLRAIFLTTITTVLGLMPLMLEQSFQARFLIPMAISISCGLMSATILVLIVLPCIVVAVDDAQRLAYLLWHGRARATAPAPLAETVMDVVE
jgi:multidrug efflux pump subunit AcrB